MISSAQEFISLRTSQIKTEYDRSAMEEAPMEVWLEIIENHPDFRRWVAHNKTVPLSILERLLDYDDMTREFVAGKRKLSFELFERLSTDPCDTVRIALAVNRKAPDIILHKLRSDRHQSVAEAAESQLKERENRKNEKASSS